ncbi:MAG: rubrerythrin family protein [Dehalococcoidales bacterium]|nr:rubrerythrin family protein [Dehalococcoidales bacterium]
MEYKTEKNLQEAFAGESQANRRYLFFAEKADKEGHVQIARLFRAAAEAETVHARNHFNAMDGIGSTRENVMAGSQGEHYEFTRMYPPFIERAEQEQNERAQKSFEYANEVEQIHFGHFEETLKALNENRQLKNEPYFVCQVCGNTVADEAPEKCPVCGTAGKVFKRID